MFSCLSLLIPAVALAQTTLPIVITPTPGNPPAQYDESKVPPYELPDVLGPAKTARDWKARRVELLGTFAREMYGVGGPRLKGTVHEVATVDPMALGGKATRKAISILFTSKADGPRMNLLLFLPNSVKGPAPVFLGLNFRGNDQLFAGERSRWPIEQILARGYGVATAHYFDTAPDKDDGFKGGVHRLFYKPGQTQPADDEWGAIGAWAWAYSRAMDYLETDKAVDAKRVIIHGHSRIGKAALWAGAQDERFAIVISNDSGAGGAALSKRIFGETADDLNRRFPHWFARNFRKYSDNEAALPFDQHMLIALIAPRPVYVCSAAEDLWADPKGEFLGALNASPVYRLLGLEGLPATEMPKIHEPVMGTIGYHIRAGKHDVTDYDWQRWIDFAQKHLGDQSTRNRLRQQP